MILNRTESVHSSMLQQIDEFKSDTFETNSKFKVFGKKLSCKNKKRKQNEDVENFKDYLMPINELKTGNYFGEVSLLTNLRRTATIYTLFPTITGWIASNDFKSLMEENADLKSNLMNKVQDYDD